MALIRLANAAGGLEMHPVNDATQLPYGSGKSKGKGDKP
jgi:hypothetical protein